MPNNLAIDSLSSVVLAIDSLSSIDYIAIKISRTIGLISKLGHFVPKHTLINIYRSLVAPYLTYGLIV